MNNRCQAPVIHGTPAGVSGAVLLVPLGWLALLIAARYVYLGAAG